MRARPADRIWAVNLTLAVLARIWAVNLTLAVLARIWAVNLTLADLARAWAVDSTRAGPARAQSVGLTPAELMPDLAKDGELLRGSRSRASRRARPTERTAHICGDDDLAADGC
jgi:hypothetical protein